MDLITLPLDDYDVYMSMITNNQFLSSVLFFIQVHKVLAGSPADRDGRIQKGDRILSINGRSMKGVSHRESLAILKVVINTSIVCF